MYSPLIRQVYDELVAKGVVTPKPEVAPPTVPMDFNWARVSNMQDLVQI